MKAPLLRLSSGPVIGKLFTPLLIQPHNSAVGACPGCTDEEGEGSGLPSLNMSTLTGSHLPDCRASLLLSTLPCPGEAPSARGQCTSVGARPRVPGSLCLPAPAGLSLSPRLKDLSVPPTGPWIRSVPSTAWAPAGPNLHQQALSHFLPHQDSLL